MPSYFVDTSALIKLYHREAGAARMDVLAREPGARLFISRLSQIEMLSAIAKKARTGAIGVPEMRQLNGLFFADLAAARFIVAELGRHHFETASRLMLAYGLQNGLRALDAIQLSVAIEIGRDWPAMTLVASDDALCTVAELEGLTVIHPLHG